MTICGSCTLCEYCIDIVNGRKYKTEELCEYFNGFGCMIYKFRPPCCRIYPFDFLFLKGEVLVFVDNRCPKHRHFVKNKTYKNELVRLLKTVHFEQWNHQPLIANKYVCSIKLGKEI